MLELLPFFPSSLLLLLSINQCVKAFIFLGRKLRHASRDDKWPNGVVFWSLLLRCARRRVALVARCSDLKLWANCTTHCQLRCGDSLSSSLV